MQIDNSFWLLNTPVAHRGLWNEILPENTLPAYKNAVDKGFAIEVDLYLTTDNKIVCFHDTTLERLTKGEGKIFEKSYDYLSSLNILGSDNKIPTLNQLLECVDGKVPLLIEFKEQPNGKALIDKAIPILKEYKGQFAVQSFHPMYVKAFKKKAPQFVRGILATNYVDVKTSAFKRFIAKNMPLNFVCKPHFISYIHTALPLKKRKVKNTPVICWTITNQQQADRALKYAKNIIFENFIPKK